ncbi:Heavy metal transport/detoxification protein [Coriobacterium glomerans PW2]|uniref:Heavy metal transport/detoxification protein n=1 Tax=Coriobacterium glomerans (strain ATCC 49209 / DSM 20642 / JCM 10262 / PW2) TaxID=700015 RepID=F2N7F0_CORGP|nr:cation transporter [Coriobacterium glomerans]AEB06766.1 Heavy metal transport/detoxification protein [Coriobacterium glomerans PW2]
MRYMIKTENMSCGHCEAAVEAALMRVAGVSDAEADSVSNIVEVDCERAIAADELKAAIESAGDYRMISVRPVTRS